jgi:hypothetical protein
MKLLYLRISPFTVAPKKTFSGKLAIASASRNNDPTTLRRQNPHNPLLKTKQHTARRGDAVQRACNLTHAHRPTALVGGASSFPSPLRLSHIPRLISIKGDGLTRSRLSKFPFSFTLSSSRGCRPILHTHHFNLDPSFPLLLHPSIGTLHFNELLPFFNPDPPFPPSIQAYVPIQTLYTCTHPSIWTLQLPPIYYARPSIWTLQFPSTGKRPRFNLDPPVQAIGFAHASICALHFFCHAAIRTLQYPIRI